jgi:hypothetical protein
MTNSIINVPFITGLESRRSEPHLAFYILADADLFPQYADRIPYLLIADL